MSKILIFLNLCSVLLMVLSIIYLARGIRYEKAPVRKNVILAMMGLFFLLLDRVTYAISNAPFAEKISESFVSHALIATNMVFLPLAAGMILIFALSLKLIPDQCE